MMDHILRKYFKYRQKQMDHVAAHPFKYQNSILRRIIRNNSKTKFGVEHGLSKIKSHADYTSGIPVRSYEELFPYIQSMLEGQQNILCADPVYWFAKSSGTSNNRSKYIPVSAKYLKKGHLKCAWDAAGMIYNEDKRAKLFEDRSLIMGGSIEKINNKINAGDISAIILHHFPPIGRRFYTPDFETALMSDWEEKIKRMASVTSRQNVTLLAGVPTWTIVLLHEILKQTGKENISEVWPNLRSYLHGGVHFEPYKDIFRELIPDENVIYREVFNASEGYFSIQNEKDQDGMLLLCDHEIFYEFIPESDISTSSPVVLSLSQVNLDTNYAMVISNTSGLYRYLLGDIIRFVSLNPFKIKVVGRTHEQINTFGEELSKANVMNALELTSKEIDFRIREFTIAPKPMTIEEGGKHEWFIEFIKAPINLAEFEEVLDSNLRRINSDYDAKRKHIKALGPLEVRVMPEHTFRQWYKLKNKFGGQNKILRLSQDRTIADELLKIIS